MSETGNGRLVTDRCMDCRKRNECRGEHKAVRTRDGWRCHGFVSRWWDERKWTA